MNNRTYREPVDILIENAILFNLEQTSDNFDFQAAFFEFQQYIKPENLYNPSPEESKKSRIYGLDKSPHMSFILDIPSFIRQYQLRREIMFHLQHQDVKVILKEVTRFISHELYDVLIIRCEVPIYVEKIQSELSRKFRSNPKYPFRPHITIAYLKKGTHKELDGGKNRFYNKEITFNTMVFSDDQRNQTNIKFN